jgi:tetratricopeptide (TPR) repeat protein
MKRQRRNRAAARVRPPGSSTNAADEMQALSRAFAAGSHDRAADSPLKRYRSILIWCGVGLLVIAGASVTAYLFLRSAEARDAYTNGQRLAAAGKYREAIVYFDRATSLDANLADAYYARASIYSKRGEFRNAIEDLTKLIALKPGYGKAYALRGAAYRSLSNYPNAITDLARAIQLQPAADNYFERASVYHAAGRNQKALADVDHAIALKPTVSFLYMARSNIRLALGDSAGYAADRKTAKELETPQEDRTQEAEAGRAESLTLSKNGPIGPNTNLRPTAK